MPHDPKRNIDESTPDYEVGRGKPPKHSQFKKGQPSANPAGRPRSRPERPDNTIGRVLAQQVTMTLGGKTRKVSLKEAITLKLANDALAGNVAAIRELNRQMKEQNAEDGLSEGDYPDINFTVEFVNPRTPEQEVLYLNGLLEQHGANHNLSPWLQEIVDERRRQGLLPPYGEVSE